MPAVVGVTGGIASGKTVVTEFLSSKFNIPVVDADVEARDVVTPGSVCLTKIKERFGDDITTTEDTLNRARLREIIFSDPEQKLWLESLLHPIINQNIKNKLKHNYPTPYVILVSPLLLESKQYEMADKIVVVDTDESIQITRAIDRDKNSGAQIKRIMSSQIQREDRLNRADYIIRNDSTLDDLYEECINLHQTLLSDLNYD